MALVDQLAKSKLSLAGNGFNPKISQPDFGFVDSAGGLDLKQSKLHNFYSVDGNPNVRIRDYNRLALGGSTTVKPPTQLDELDPIAPKLSPFGVVSQSYRSKVGLQYKQLGPSDGRY